MHEIRKNTVEEVDIIKMSFKYETIRILFDLLKAIVAGGICVGGVVIALKVADAVGLGIFLAVLAGFFAIGYLVGLLLKIIGCKKSTITVSNRRIYGKYGPYLIKKTFSYRLDEIDNVELKDMIGAKAIVINFQDGKGPFGSPQVKYSRRASQAMMGLGVFVISSVVNCQEVYDKLSELLLSLKSNVDLQTDIQMAKVDAENRKAEAIEKIASNGVLANQGKTNSTSYIDEIKELKKLLDEGTITKEEFEQEKKEILDSNH